MPVFGIQRANQAVQELENLGAIVYPPGNKAEVEWEDLAGESLGFVAVGGQALLLSKKAGSVINPWTLGPG